MLVLLSLRGTTEATPRKYGGFKPISRLCSLVAARLRDRQRAKGRRVNSGFQRPQPEKFR